MELPTPPTDNFYKFLAIAGLLVVISSVTSPIWLHRNVEEQRAEFIKDATTVNLEAGKWQQIGSEMDRATVRSDGAHKRLEDAVSRFKDSKVSIGETEQALADADEARKEVFAKTKEFRLESIEWGKKNAELDYKRSLLEINESRLESTKTLSLIGLIFGIGLSSVGFTLWYRRTQKPEDAVLQNKAKSSDVED